MENAVEGGGKENIDEFNDETFGDGATDSDWEVSHYRATEELLVSKPSHGGGRVHTLEEVEQEQNVSSVEQKIQEMKIKELWPTSPQQDDLTGSIWSSPKLPSRSDDAKLSAVPLGSKVISLADLERAMTESSPSLEETSSLSPSHHVHQPDVSPPTLSPAHMTPPPGHGVMSPCHGVVSPGHGATPSPAHMTPPPGLGARLAPSHMTPPNSGHFPGKLPPHPIHHGMHPPPPPGAIRPHPLHHHPHPHPQFLRGGMQQQFPWLVQRGYMPPPPGGMPNIPPPNIPLIPRMRPLSPYPPPPHGPHPPTAGGMARAPPTGMHQPRPPFIPGPPPGHQLYYYMQPQPQPMQLLQKSKRSEYLDEMKADGSGFMTQKEKDWVIRIQLVQLHSQDPDNEDYYYQNYKKRQTLRRLQQSHVSSNTNSADEDESGENSSPSRSRALPTLTSKEYQPKEFQGALGKLTVSSIAAPRKMIDVTGSEGTGKEGEGVVKDTHRKRRQALMTIEKLYDSVLLLEEVDRKSRLLAQSDVEERAVLVSQKDAIVDKAYSLLKLTSRREASPKPGPSLVQLIMSYRKGKRVINRILPFLQDEQAFAVVQATITHLPAIIKKDTADLVLPELTTCFETVVSQLSLVLLSSCLSGLLRTLTSTAYVLRVCLNEFSGRVLKSILDCGREKVTCSSKEKEGPGGNDTNSAELWCALVRQLYSLLEPHEKELASKFPISGVNLVQFIASLT